MIFPILFPAQPCARCGTLVDAADAIAVVVVGEDGRELDAMAHANREECKAVLA